MSGNVKVYGESEFPVTTPGAAGAIYQTADGSIVQAARNGKGGLSWALLFAGSLLSTVMAAEDSTAVLQGTLSAGNNTLTKNGNGTLNTENVGGRNNWAVGDRLLIVYNMNSLAVGVWEVLSVGAAGAPWVLTRALDARTASAMPVGRTFTVLQGNRQGMTYTHTTATVLFPVPGTDALEFRSVQDFGVSVQQFTGEQRDAYGIGALYAVEVVIAAGAGGARDVAVFGAGADNKANRSGRLVEIVGNVTTLVADSSLQARSAAAGGGSALSGPVSTAAVGRTRDAAGGGIIANPEVLSGNPLYLRMTDGDAAGRFNLIFRAV